LETIRGVGGWSEMAVSLELVVRESTSSKEVNTEVEGPTVLEAVTRQRLAKTQQIEKTVLAVVNCRVCELAATL
jgi:hypothetical protein